MRLLVAVLALPFAAAFALSVAVAGVAGGVGGPSPPTVDAPRARPGPRSGSGTGIPPAMLARYREAAPACPGLPWEVLAGIGAVETDHGRHTATSPAGAQGPMQFLPATWAAYGVDADGDGDPPRIDDPADAVLTAARYLCANGAGRPADLAGAIWAYNHSPAYVAAVMAAARRYATVTGDTAALDTLRGA